jgi:hypothetical protein
MLSMTKYKAVPDFPPPKINQHRPVPPGTQADFIAGDPAGLYQLATSLYAYVSAHSSQTVNTLRDTVVGLVKDDNEAGGYTPGPDGGWIGETANVFRNTFISDAAMMNGLNTVMCTVAATVDDLASGLATQESQLEYDLEDQLSRLSRRRFSVNWLVTSGSGRSPTFAFTAQGKAAFDDSSSQISSDDAIPFCSAIAMRHFQEAARLRAGAASQLAAVGKILEEAFSYYDNYSAGPGSPTTMDPSVLLTSGQATSDAPAVKDLQGKYSRLVAELKDDSLDDDAVKKTLLGMGVAAGSASKILDGIKAVQDAKGTVATGSKFLSLVGEAIPVLMLIGMAA